MTVQNDNSSVVDLLDSFCDLKRAWLNNNTWPSSLQEELKTIFNNRLTSFTESQIGACAYHLREFLALSPEQCNLFTTNENDQKFESWATSVLPASRIDLFRSESDSLNAKRMLEISILNDSYPVFKTLANILKKVPISEAAVERAFSKHKLLHNRLRANLCTETLENQLFIRYNFARIMNIAHNVHLSESLEEEILAWCE